MFNTNFTINTSTALPSHITRDQAINLLHDHSLVVTLDSQYNSHELVKTISDTQAEYRVDTQLSFVPRSLWKGGVKYKSIYTKLEDGCDITVEAPFFNSINRWRIQDRNGLHICMNSEATCGKLFVGSVKGFIESSHGVQQSGLVKELDKRYPAQGQPAPARGENAEAGERKQPDGVRGDAHQEALESKPVQEGHIANA